MDTSVVRLCSIQYVKHKASKRSSPAEDSDRSKGRDLGSSPEKMKF